MRGLVNLLGVELAGLASLDELGGILKRCGPVETAAEGFSGEGTRRGVVATVSAMDVVEELVPFFCGDAPQRNPIGALAVYDAVLDEVEPGLASHALRSSVILGEVTALHIVLELCDPARGLMR